MIFSICASYCTLSERIGVPDMASGTPRFFFA
jgi:hypothetical protein